MDSTVFNVGDVWTKVFFYYSTLRHVFEEKIFLPEAHYVLQYRYCTVLFRVFTLRYAKRVVL